MLCKYLKIIRFVSLIFVYGGAENPIKSRPYYSKFSMDIIPINELGEIDVLKFPFYEELAQELEKSNYNPYSLKTCGGHCGSNNCS